MPASLFLSSLAHPSPVSSLPKDALTDLTGDAERLPVEGHHGTWLGHKVPHIMDPRAPGLLSSPASMQRRVLLGVPPCLLGLLEEIGQRGMD